jgi:murein DD-endopeptidase MepM/ murein hydrolase activator NlpD
MNIKTQKKTFIYLSIIATFFVVSTAHADLVQELRNKISDTNDQVKNIEKEISAFTSQLKKTQAERSTLNNTIKTLDINKQIVTKDITLTKTKIENSNQNIEEIDTNIQKLESTIGINKLYLRKSLQNLAADDALANSGLISTILGSDSISEAVDRASTLANFHRSMLTHINDIRTNKSSLEGVKQIKTEERNELFNLNQELVAKQKILNDAVAEKNRLLRTTRNKEANFQAELKKREETRRKMQAEMLAYENELRVAIDPSTLPKTGTEILGYPLANVRITQYFGNTAFASRNAQVYGGRGHNGVDFAAPVGTRLLSAAAGVVQGTGDTDSACRGASYGKWVLIRHNNGLTTLYAHLSAISVSPGQAVSRGDIIGLSGNTGYSTGPHLHFSVFASRAVSIVTRQSRACGTMMTLPVSPTNGYLNPLSYLQKIQ